MICVSNNVSFLLLSLMPSVNSFVAVFVSDLGCHVRIYVKRVGF